MEEKEETRLPRWHVRKPRVRRSRDTACAAFWNRSGIDTPTRGAELRQDISTTATTSTTVAEEESIHHTTTTNATVSEKKPEARSTAGESLRSLPPTTSQQAYQPNHSTSRLSRTTMGYSGTNDSYHTTSISSPSAWSARAATAPSSSSPSPHITPIPQRLSERRTSDATEVIDNTTGAVPKAFADDDEKTMEYSTSTAPTQTTGLSNLGPDHAEEDDTTTIRSLDSVQERGLIQMTEDDEDENVEHHQHPYDAPAPAAAPAEANSTCSVSTAPSTDEASSLGGVDWNSYDPTSRLKQQVAQHRRVPSWEVSPHSQFSQSAAAAQHSPGMVNLPPSFSPGWGPPQQRVASFRGEQQQQLLQQQNYPPLVQQQQQQRGMNVNSSNWTHHHPTPPRYGMRNDPSSLPFLPATMSGARGGHDSPRGIYQRQNSPSYPYPMQQQQQLQQPQQQRKPYSQPPLPPSTTTPPRGAAGATGERGSGGRGHHRVLSSGGGSATKTPTSASSQQRAVAVVHALRARFSRRCSAKRRVCTSPTPRARLPWSLGWSDGSSRCSTASFRGSSCKRVCTPVWRARLIPVS